MRANPLLPLRAAAAMAFLCLLFVLPLEAQTASTASATAATPAEDALPQLQDEKAENPFSRFEIVSLGSLPITVFYVDLGFDLQAWIASGYDSAYTPIVSATNSSLNDTQRLQRLGVALGVACVIGAIDAIIHASKVKAAKRLREAMMSSDPANGP